MAGVAVGWSSLWLVSTGSPHNFVSRLGNFWCDGSSAIVLIPEPQSRQAQEAVGVVTRDLQGGGKASGLPSCAEAQHC